MVAIKKLKAFLNKDATKPRSPRKKVQVLKTLGSDKLAVSKRKRKSKR